MVANKVEVIVCYRSEEVDREHGNLLAFTNDYVGGTYSEMVHLEVVIVVEGTDWD